MLGGFFWIAFLRNALSAGLMLAFFLMLDRPRFSMKKTMCIYTGFGTLLVIGYSVWYLLDNSSFVKFAALSVFPVIGVFCTLLSSEVLYLSLYKMALAFYLFSVCTFCGVDVARWWFEGNVWVDIIVRLLCLALILTFTWKKMLERILPVCYSWKNSDLSKENIFAFQEEYYELLEHNGISFTELSKDYQVSSRMLFLYQDNTLNRLLLEQKHT